MWLCSSIPTRGAYFKDVSGWEGADWYAPPGVQPQVERLSWGRQNWFPYWRAEHEAARSGVILMDMSFMSKFFVQGRDAGRVLNWLSANNVDGEPGRITYTQWLNESGKIEADLTVTKLNDEHFMVVASDTAHGHALARLTRYCEGAHAFATDVTGAWAQINIQGPRSRELLQPLTSVDLSNAAFPFRCAREIDLGLARAPAIRITYLGELGYELCVSAELAMHQTPEVHSLHVAALALSLFDQTKRLHGLGQQERTWLEYAALLHDIGYLINPRQHHKHAYYLIKHSDLGGLTADEIEVVANVARYHRRAIPTLKHQGFGELAPRLKRIVKILSALLRIADALDRTHFSTVQTVNVKIGTTVSIEATVSGDAEMELWAAKNRADLFEQAFRRRVRFCEVPQEAAQP